MRKNSLTVVFFAFILIIIGGGLFLLLGKNADGTAATDFNTVADKVTSPSSPVNDSPATSELFAPQGWSTYSNADLKFSINYPKTAYNPYGNCVQTEERGQKTYRPQTAEVPLKIFEQDDGSIYISFEYSYALSEERSVDGYSYFDKCTKKPTTVEDLKTKQISWNIVAKQVESQTALQDFIKQRFGEGCSIGTMATNTENSKVYDVKIQGDGLDPGESKCFINYMYVLKYSPEIKMVFTYNLGQAYTFAKTVDGSEAYDDDMSKSFEPIL